MSPLPRSVQFDDELPPSARLDPAPADDTEEYLRKRGGTAAFAGPVQQPKPAPTPKQIAEENLAGKSRRPPTWASQLAARTQGMPQPELGPIVEGATKIAKGLKEAPGPLEVTKFKRHQRGWDIESNPEARARAFKSGSEIIGGAMEAASPLVPGALAKAPLETAAGLAAGTAAQHLVPPVAQRMGATPEGAQFAGDVAGMLPIAGAGAAVLRKMRPARPAPPVEATPSAESAPPPPPPATERALPPVTPTEVIPPPPGPKRPARRTPAAVQTEAAGVPSGEAPLPTISRKRKKKAVPPQPAPQGKEVIPQATTEVPPAGRGAGAQEIEVAAQQAEPQAGMLVTFRQLWDQYSKAMEAAGRPPSREAFDAHILEGAKDGRWVLNETSNPAGEPIKIPIGNHPDGTPKFASGMALKVKRLAADESGAVQIPETVRAAGEAVGEAAKRGAETVAAKGRAAGEAVGEAAKRGAETVAAKGRAAEEAFVDDLAPVRRLDQLMYESARNFRGYLGKVMNRVDALREVLPKRGYTQDRQALAEQVARGDIQAGETLATESPKLLTDMLHYMELERHLELGTRIQDYRTPGGQTLEQIAAEKAGMEQALGPQRLTELQQSAAGVRQFWNGLMAEARDAGLMSADDYQTIMSRNEKYYPLERLEFIADSMEGASGAQLPTGTRSMRVPLSAKEILLRKAEGSTKAVADPLETTLRKIQRVTSLIEKNKVNQHLLRISEQPGFENLVFEIPPRGPGFSPRYFGQLGVFENGQLRRFVVPKPVSEAIEGLNRQQLDMVTKWVSASSAALRQGATSLNIPFLPANLIRDAQTMAVRGRYTPKEWMKIEPVRDWVRGFTHSILSDLGVGKSEQFVKRYLEAGAGMSSFFQTQQTLGRLRQGLLETQGQRLAREIVNPLALLRWAQSHVEMAPRLAQFERGLKKEMSDPQAAFFSREATVDFSKAGTWGRMVNMWIPFLNARAQGNINMLRALSTDPGRASNWFSLGLTVGLPTVATWAYNHKYYPDVLKDIPRYEKDRYTFLIGSNRKDAKGRYLDIVKIPKGDTMIFSNPLEQVLESTIGDNPQAIERLVVQTASDFSPVGFAREGQFSPEAIWSSALPPAPKGLIENTTNKNFWREQEVVPTRGPYGDLTKASPEQQYKVDTPQIYVDASRILKQKMGIGLSPLKIQNFMQAQFGGLEQEITQPDKIAEAVRRRFTTAPGENVENKRWKLTEVSDPKVRDKEATAVRGAMEMWNTLKTAGAEGPDAMRTTLEGFLKAGQLTEETAKYLNREIEREFGEDITGPDGVKRRVILTPYERNMRAQPATYRAQRLLDYLPTLPPEEKRRVAEDWLLKGIINERTAAEMNKLLQQRQTQ